MKYLCPIDDFPMQQASGSFPKWIEPHFVCFICGLVLPKSLFNHENKKLEIAIDYFLWISKEKAKPVFKEYYKQIVKNMTNSFKKTIVPYLL